MGHFLSALLASDSFDTLLRPRLNFLGGHFGAWVDIRVRSDVPVLLDRGIDDMINVWHLFEYVEYALATTELRSATIESHLSAIKFVHRTSRDLELDTTHPVIASAFDGAARSHVEVGNQATVRRPLSWGMLLAAEKLIPILSNGGRGLWLAIGSSFCLLNASPKCFGIPFANPRNVLFTAGRRGFISRSGTVGGGAMVDNRRRRGLTS